MKYLYHGTLLDTPAEKYKWPALEVTAIYLISSCPLCSYVTTRRDVEVWFKSGLAS